MMVLLLIIFLAYLIGSIPTAVWVGRKFHGIDVREHGSKNAGATNTFRVLGRKSGWFVLIIDVLKGLLAAILPLLFKTEYDDNQLLFFQLSTSFVCIIGHVYPVFAQFRGGKGVATALGIIIGLNPFSAGISLLIFLIVFFAFRYVSLGAIITSIAYPFISYFVVKEDAKSMIVFSVLLGVLIVLSHRKNIKRLINGEESRMNLSKRKA